jgi:tetratricopeptide (TPR) repeat protein
LQQVLDEFVKKLKAQPETAEGWIQLARLYIHSALLPDAQHALEQAIRLQPDNLQAVVAQIDCWTNKARPTSPPIAGAAIGGAPRIRLPATRPGHVAAAPRRSTLRIAWPVQSRGA